VAKSFCNPQSAIRNPQSAMRRLLQKFYNRRIRALMRKEFNQIKRDRRLAFSLILPPTLQLLLFGFALNAEVTNLRLGVVDDSKTPESRELIATMSESRSFRLAGYYLSTRDLGDAINRNNLDAGLVIPYDFTRDLRRGRGTTAQVLLNATNANTAAIGQGYIEGIIQAYNLTLLAEGIRADFRRITPTRVARRGRAALQPAFLYNPGLEDSWFIVTGVLGLLLILNSSLVASGAMVKEREAGTIEQLLMSPASTTEIIAAKIAPLFVLLCLMALMAIGIIKLVFRLPFHGSLTLVLCASALCVMSGISIGTVIATFSKSAQQALLTSFFVNPPLATLSGAFNPVEAMPRWLQPLTVINPIHHFATIARASMLKGSGLADLWPNFLGLLIITLVLFSLSVWRFRKQLS
jgi:ABC-2 type transport system permease protein